MEKQQKKKNKQKELQYNEKGEYIAAVRAAERELFKK